MPAARLPDTTRAGAPSIWHDRAFRLIWAGQTTSLFGDQVTGLALPWLILLQTHSALDAGLVASARYVPLLTLGLLAGVLADRLDRRVLMIASDCGRALALGAVALLGALRQTPALWLLALVVLVLGTGQLFFQVAYQAWLPDMTGDQQLSRANAALEASDAVSVLAGYPLAGALISAIGPVLALGADALSFVVSALTLRQVRHVRHTHPVRPASAEGAVARKGRRRGRLRDAWAEAGAGARTILGMPELRLLNGVGTALHLNIGAIVVLVATLTQLRLHVPAWQAGLVFGAMGAGGLIGSALAPRIYDWSWRRGLAGALGVVALGCLGLAWASVLDPAGGFAVALVADLLMDGAAALGFILIGTATALVTPRDLRGRVNAASAIYSSAVRGVAVIGGGALAATGNPLPAFLLLAGCGGGAALLAAGARAVEAHAE